jgi:hypothetical protein
MTRADDAWEALGDLSEEEALHVLTRLYALYEETHQHHLDDEAADRFFTNLFTAITQTRECNLNRR